MFILRAKVTQSNDRWAQIIRNWLGKKTGICCWHV